MQPARLRVRVHPGAHRDGLEGWRNGVLHVGVVGDAPGAPANPIVVALVAERLRVGPARVSILFGDEDRLKEIAVAELDQETAEARLKGPAALTGGRRGRVVATVLVLAAVAVLVVVLSSGSGGTTQTTGTTPGDGGVAVGATAGATTTSARRSRARHRAVRRRPAVDPGTLAQTEARPSAHTREFAIRMHALWRAIAGGPATDARPAFFPQSAYAQLKSVGDPAGDWLDRLYADYRLDISAAHAQLGSGAAGTRLLRTDTVAAYAHWVPPGVCENRVGYWELPNARLVYHTAGQVRSIGIASLISWRGVWYVIHLGLVAANSVGGVVDSPSAGPGTSAPSNTC